MIVWRAGKTSYQPAGRVIVICIPGGSNFRVSGYRRIDRRVVDIALDSNAAAIALYPAPGNERGRMITGKPGS